MSYSLHIKPIHNFLGNEDLDCTYNGGSIYYYDLVKLPHWGGADNYWQVESALVWMLGTEKIPSGGQGGGLGYFTRRASNFSSVQMDVTEGELPILTFRTYDDRTVSVVYKDSDVQPVWNISDLLEYLTRARIAIQSQVKYLQQMAVPDGHEVVVRPIYYRSRWSLESTMLLDAFQKGLRIDTHTIEITPDSEWFINGLEVPDLPRSYKDLPCSSQDLHFVQDYFPWFNHVDELLEFVIKCYYNEVAYIVFPNPYKVAPYSGIEVYYRNGMRQQYPINVDLSTFLQDLGIIETPTIYEFTTPSHFYNDNPDIMRHEWMNALGYLPQYYGE